MNDYTYIVTVSADSQTEANQVIQERIVFDEDYGFPYEISVDTAYSGDMKA